MSALACSFNLASMQSHIQTHCDYIGYKWRGFGSQGQQRWPVWRRPRNTLCLSQPSLKLVWAVHFLPKLQPDQGFCGTQLYTFLGKTSSPEGLAMLSMLLETYWGRCSSKDMAEKMLVRRQGMDADTVLEWVDPRQIRGNSEGLWLLVTRVRAGTLLSLTWRTQVKAVRLLRDCGLEQPMLWQTQASRTAAATTHNEGRNISEACGLWTTHTRAVEN